MARARGAGRGRVGGRGGMGAAFRVRADSTSASMVRPGSSFCVTSPAIEETGDDRHNADSEVAQVTLPGGEIVPGFGLGTWHMGEDRRRAADEDRRGAARHRARHDPDRHGRDVRQRRAPRRSSAEAPKGLRDRLFIVSKVLPHNASRTRRRRGLRAQPEAAQDRPDRPVPAALARLGAARRDAGRVRAVAARRQDPPSRGQQFQHRGHARMGRAGRRRNGRRQPDPVQSEPARPGMGADPVVPRARHRDHGLFAARTGAHAQQPRAAGGRGAARRDARRRSRSPGCCARTG